MVDNNTLFEFAKHAVWDQGGDGDVVIISPYGYKGLASEFREREALLKNPDYKLDENNTDNSIVFVSTSYNQEAIIFTDYLDPVNFPFYDTVIIINY